MGLELSKKVKAIIPSATLEMSGRCAQLRDEGVDIVAFNVGEPDFKTPEHISEALIKAINDGHTKYVSVNGIIELRETICRKLKKDNGLNYSPDQIVVSTGAKQALYNVITALVDEGDQVIIPTPCWVSYEEMVKINKGECIFVPTNENDFQLNIELIEKAISSKTKAIIINTPNNPTGCVYTKGKLEELAKLAIKYEFYVIVDEIYEKLVYGDNKHISIGSLNDKIFQQTITINGYAKAYVMTGHRIGYAAAPLTIAKEIIKLQSHMTSNSTTPVQYAAITALESNQQFVVDMVEEFSERYKLSLELLSDIPNIKFNKLGGAFYIMIDVSYFFDKEYDGVTIKNADDLAIYLLEKAHVAVVSGSSFQAPNYVRFSYSNSQENIKEGIKKIKEALKRLE